MKKEISIEVKMCSVRPLINFDSTVGYIEPQDIVEIIKHVNLGSNPRTPIRKSLVVPEIIKTLEHDPQKFPLKSKGILVAAGRAISNKLDHTEENRIVKFSNSENEGILDGGHNLLAAGLHILSNNTIDTIDTSRIENWEDLQEAFNSIQNISTQNKFLMPIEIISLSQDEIGGEPIRDIFASISSARNFNTELKHSAIANYAGYYNYLKSVLSSDCLRRISWRQNEDGINDVDLVIRLAWSVLSIIDFEDEELNSLKINGAEAFSDPDKAIKNYSQIISNKKTSKKINNLSKSIEIYDKKVLSALDMVNDILESYDIIYENYQFAYNKSGGKFGKLNYVANQPEKTGLPFSTKEFSGKYPHEAMIFPIIFSVRQLVGKYPEQSPKAGQLGWLTRPQDFFSNIDNLSKIIGDYRLAYDLNSNINAIASNEAAYDEIENTVSLLLANS